MSQHVHLCVHYNLCEDFEYVSMNLDNKVPVDTLYLDFSKAFDKIPHERVLKLKAHVEGRIHNWIDY